jgi:hypothetical protein
MGKHRNPRPNVPKHPPTHNPPRRTTDTRAHVTALRELAALGWHLVEIRPDREPPLLWSVTVRRFDHNVEITVTDADPDAALEEALHFAACDEDEPSVELPSESTERAPDAVPLPAGTPPEGSHKGTPDDPSVGSLRTRDELEAALNALGWTIVTGPTQTANNWKATMRRGTANVPMTGLEELDLLKEMLRFAQMRGGTKP